jgi:beta-glucanase (GH16 family)
MNKKLVILMAFLLPLSSCSPPEPAASPTSTPEWERPGWTLVWHDEFDGEALDLQSWTYDIGGGGWGNHEWEFYTDRPENARLEDGRLVIEARAEEFMGRNYTSARLKTQGLHAWTYGRVEARMKLPSGQGIWPAFWMLGGDINQVGWPECGEIDIMEYIGRDDSHAYGTVHGPGYSGGNGVGASLALPPGELSQDFHVFAIEWEPQQIRWYVDDEQYFSVDPGRLPGRWVYDHPFFVILNLAVGGDWPGYPDETTVFPQTLQVDYVRVYQKPDAAGENLGMPGAMHLGDIQLSARDNEDGTWDAIATMKIVDEAGKPVDGARVAGGWVGAVIRGEESGTSGADGSLQLVSEPVRRQGEVTFCVISAAHNRYTYDKTANERNCAKVEH